MVILPGYPKDNPILRGIESILGGMDPELAMARRDAELEDAKSFANAAIEAACWIPKDSPLLDDLLSQADMAYKRASQVDRNAIAKKLLLTWKLGGEQIEPLIHLWGIEEASR